MSNAVLEPPSESEPTDTVEVAEVEVPTMTQRTLVQFHDRCDRCGSEAYVLTRHGDFEMLWCGHHFAANEAILSPLVVLDERSRLHEKLVSSY